MWAMSQNITMLVPIGAQLTYDINSTQQENMNLHDKMHDFIVKTEIQLTRTSLYRSSTD